jgi:hypothetical protein
MTTLILGNVKINTKQTEQCMYLEMFSYSVRKMDKIC